MYDGWLLVRQLYIFFHLFPQEGKLLPGGGGGGVGTEILRLKFAYLTDF